MLKSFLPELMYIVNDEELGKFQFIQYFTIVFTIETSALSHLPKFKQKPLISRGNECHSSFDER